MKKIYALIMFFLFLSTFLGGCIKEKLTSTVKAEASDNPKYSFSSLYSMEGFVIQGRAPQYNLPLKLDEIRNWDEINAHFNLNDEQKNLLRKNGFVIIPYGEIDDITTVYKNLKNENIPIFVTSDTLLHIYHIQFNEILKNIEEREFFDYLVDLSKAMFERAKKDYEMHDNPLLKEASRRNVAYFGVALKLLGEDVELPSYVNEEVNGELEAIERHEGYEVSKIFHYEEDYSQYIPRGHYTQSERLRKYFKTMMWYGRMAFLLKGGEPNCQSCEFLISEEDSNIATLQACLISSELTEINVGENNAFELWKRMYAITSFFVGVADDLTPYEYLECLVKVFGNKTSIEELSNESNLLAVKIELAKMRSPEIYGGTGNCIVSPPFTKDKLNEVLNKTKGMRFMGQRYVPDSYIFQQLVSPAVGMYMGNDTPFTMETTGGGKARCFPRGLDIMAVLGSDRALEILEKEGDTEYEYYHQQLQMLREKFNSMNSTEWNRNLYWSWLYTLKALIKKFGESYPTFMQTEAWLDKELQTSLASWAELRHDTILYAKQSYTPRLSAMPTPTAGYVEPVPEFYARMKALVNMTLNGLKNFGVINEIEEYRLIKLESILDMLLEISKKELEGKEFSESSFLSNFVEEINETVSGLNREARKTLLVADVHTDANTMQCLEEGIGYVDLVLVVYKTGNSLYMAGGPVFSYYEFKQPVEKRLTDEEWENMLGDVARPSWVSSFFAP